jgi:hypothetical protein
MKREMTERPPHTRQGLRVGKITVILSLSAVGWIGASVTRAQDLNAERFTFRGFGTLALTTHDAEGIEFRRNVSQARGVEADEIEGQADSLAGLQLNVKLASRFDLALQGVSRVNVDGDWTPRITQAFVRYSPDESLVLRAGRFGYDIYLLAESRQVGYSYLAIRPSQDFYGLVTNDEVDGLDIAWTGRLGRGLVKARAFGGGSSDATAMSDGSKWESRSDAVGVNFDYIYQSFTARAAVLQVTYGASAELRGLGEFLVSTGAPQAVSIGEELRESRQVSRGMQLGVAYDDGPFQAQLLYGHIVSDSIAGPNVNAVYAQLGYRVRAFTPFVSFARSKDREPLRVTGLPDLPELAPVNFYVQSIQDNLRATQHSTSAGVRWDFSPNWDFKLQADFTSIQDSVLNLDRRPPGSGDARMTVITAGVDFVF